ARIAAAALAPMWARAPAPSVTLTASARPLSGRAVLITSSGSHESGGAISAVIAKRPLASTAAKEVACMCISFIHISVQATDDRGQTTEIARPYRVIAR